MPFVSSRRRIWRSDPCDRSPLIAICVASGRSGRRPSESARSAQAHRRWPGRSPLSPDRRREPSSAGWRRGLAIRGGCWRVGGAPGGEGEHEAGSDRQGAEEEVEDHDRRPAVKLLGARPRNACAPPRVSSRPRFRWWEKGRAARGRPSKRMGLCTPFRVSLSAWRRRLRRDRP